MAFLDPGDVQPWLERTKLSIESVDDGILDALRLRVFGVLTSRYDATLWTDRASTPALVRQVMAMRYAAAHYRLVYSEDLDTDPAWPIWLEATADGIVTDVLSGTLQLLDADASETTLYQPSFYPTDAATDTDDPRLFTIAQVF